jgi:hypothetical protein
LADPVPLIIKIRRLEVSASIPLKAGMYEGSSKKYGCTRLLYYEEYDDVFRAIAREKQLKGWRRSKKVSLIERVNPSWKDLAAGIDERVAKAKRDSAKMRALEAAAAKK